ncbi:Bug family tripartite tricarboxylate transporter substrate binding protein [Pseudorhodoferax soli]|uniref:Tripartite-type tricarboxylate transporter receptor subunit TctC n=1 Tax=Pseudorhodoferax soli TaxID=545864 RepID=A0A368X5B6_9BURK|nr:tripartite tricarboxylate transporter substrate binding protein [Pseudorhodoferax soli]RCW63190.1 tripartite-type tricarboxylate transporter receptor subunit TctC [Pseudorhodoferax soli]
MQNTRINAGRRQLIAAAAAAPFVGAHAASEWPQKTIRIVVPFPPGGLADFLGRHVGNFISKDLGTPVIVENRPGGGSNIGSNNVAKAAGDGYTLLLATSANAANVTLFRQLSYDPLRDFEPLTILAEANTSVVAHPSAPFSTIKELIEYAKSKPDEVAYGSPGIGTPGHLAAELLKQKAGIRMRHVPYQGAPQAAQDVMGNVTPVAFVNVNVSQTFIAAKRLKGLAVTGPTRWVQLPDVPTIAESGVEGYAWTSWMGLVAPTGTPQPVLDRLQKAISTARTDASFQAIRMQGSEPVFTSSADMRARLRSDVAAYASVIKLAGISVD